MLHLPISIEIINYCSSFAIIASMVMFLDKPGKNNKNVSRKKLKI